MEDTFKFMTIKTKHIYESYKSYTQMSEVKHFSTIHFKSVKKGAWEWVGGGERKCINKYRMHLFPRMHTI